MNYKNFAYSLVAIAPIPATSGTTLIVTTGEGVKFPVVPFYTTIWPGGAMPSITNAEIVIVTDVTADTLTITRQAESTNARAIVVGDQIANTLTAETIRALTVQKITIVNNTYNISINDQLIICDKSTPFTITLPPATGSGKKFDIKNINTGIVTVEGDGADTIEGVLTKPIVSNYSLTLVDYIANKWIMLY
jgi:hypothetical protein